MSTACSSALFYISKLQAYKVNHLITSQAHAQENCHSQRFEHDSFLRNGRHGGVQHMQQKKSEYKIFMKREKI